MTKAYGVLLLLLAIQFADSQDPQPANVYRLETRYDYVTDTTTVKCDLVELIESSSRLAVQVGASFPGKGAEKEPNGATKIGLFISSSRRGATRRTQPLFREATTLRLVMDSTQLDIQVKDYRSDFHELVSSFSESARAEVGREDLRKLLNARSLKCAWGGAEFKFSDGALASLKKFVSSQAFDAR
jgi:hypothetical protein